MRALHFLLFLSLISFFTACGSDSDDDDSAQNEESEQQDDQGTYQAILTPLNVSSSGSPSATATIRIRGDEVEVRNVADNTPKGIRHQQHVWTGRACPTPQNDTDLNGIIDYTEAKGALGTILIPLDNDLSSQTAGGNYPVANSSGDYNYLERTSLARLSADLHAPDPAPNDDFSKLDPQDNLNLAGRAVVIHGVSGNSSLPIACGILARVADPVPEPVPEPVPVPVPVPVPACPVETEFETRLNNQLLIEGVRCRGGETTEVEHDDGTSSVYVCRRGQWLVTVDNINTCTDEGLCTEIFVFPIITNLSRAGNSNPPYQCTYNFWPRSPASHEQRRIMRDHQVRFSRDTEPVVIRKN